MRNLGKKKAKQRRKIERRRDRKKEDEFGTVIERKGRKVIAMD